VAEQVLSLPMHPYLNEAEQHAVVAALQGAWS
jgi:dTDP-4-amino-4,6-dideoxygalactose transaminase